MHFFPIKKIVVFPMRNSEKLGKEIAEHGKFKTGKMSTTFFPDGELHLQFLNDVKGKEVVLVQSLSPEPNESLLELVFAGKTAKDLGARKVIGVIPYLAYMRQDKRFMEGECVSNRILSWMLSHSMDKIITVDPHLHRIKSMAELFHIEHKKISANSAIGDYIEKNFSDKNTIIAGPDIESSQWASRIAQSIHYKSVIFLKERFSSRHVKINVTEELDWKGKDVVIVDDIISSGHTMIEAVKEILKRKPRSVHCICVHGIFAEGAFEKLKKAGAKTIISTNSVSHKSNGINLAETIAKEIQ